MEVVVVFVRPVPESVYPTLQLLFVFLLHWFFSFRLDRAVSEFVNNCFPERIDGFHPRLVIFDGLAASVTMGA